MNRRNTVWITAALVVLATIGAAYFGLRDESGAREIEQHVEASAPSAAATVGNEGVDDAADPVAVSGATAPAARNLARSPVAQPFEFLRDLAKAAYDGDGDAQYRIAKELDRCEMTLSLVRKSIDPEAAIWNLPAGWTQGMKERAFAEFHRCARLLREDPFAELPKRPGGYDAAYWMARATESGQPLAVVEKAVTTLLAPPVESDQAEEIRTAAREMLVKATLSGNPDALLLMGFKMRNSTDAGQALQGAAWMLAGCRAGADCGFDSSIVPIWMCYDSGDAQCPPGLDVETLLSRALGPADFARVHTHYERISAELHARDTAAIGAELGF